ncbi:MAG: hypothetical protein B7X41_02305 [Microbacterium sp. 14-71-5]|uniref:hypothetical protein n=1 Tax=Microbacterium sp. 13-71-7 TaxID=1970399 RepID=UPI000BCAB67A|nr:hypothetical protein [Microbacterium sp. 13-71-7]OZB83226.1 MAG: hypothetical protein B7X32_11020 [Microbacterium sp. 13-71-7]OZB89535.1 MAG: hypothetical protein B7X41_02305 [Microbacterium sp. 14-71-5]
MTDQTQSQATRGRAGISAWGKRHWVSIALVLISLVYGGAVTLLHDDAVSPIDEVVYLDYTFKVWDEGFVRQGETFGDDVAEVVACDHVVPFGDLGQKCGSGKVDLAGMPNKGITTGSGYTPAYFWTVRLIGDPIHAVTGLSQVTSWRLSGVIWLAGTMLMLVGLLRRTGASNVVAFTLGLLFIASPYAWWTYTYLSTDTSVVFFGAAILFMTIEAVHGRRSPWWLLPLAVLAPLFKITNLLVFGLVLFYLAIHSIAARRRAKAAGEPPRARSGSRRLWGAVALATVLAAAVQVVWMRLTPLLAVKGPGADQGISSSLSGSELLRLMLSGVSGPITHNPAAGIFPSTIYGDVFIPLAWIMIAAIVGSLMVIRWDPERGPLIWATAIASVTALPALGVVMAVLTQSYFDLPARYGASLIPAALVVVGFMLKNRIMIGVTAAYAVFLLVFGVALAVRVGLAF